MCVRVPKLVPGCVSENLCNKYNKTDGLYDSVSGSWEFWALLMRPAADGKKRFLWRVVLVLMDPSL